MLKTWYIPWMLFQMSAMNKSGFVNLEETLKISFLNSLKHPAAKLKMKKSGTDE